MIGIAALLGGCVTPAPAPVVKAPVRAEVVVDERAPAGGDGTAAAPFRTVPAQRPPGARVRLRAGLYRGPFEVRAGEDWEGTGVVVLYAEGGGTVVSALGGALHHLSLQGGEVGLAVQGEVGLDALHFSGQRKTGVLVAPGGRLTGQQLTFDAVLPDAVAVEARQARVSLTDVRVEGGWRRGLSQAGGRLELVGARFVGVGTPLHLVEAHSTVERVDARAGRGDAVFARGGTLTVRGLTVQGHETALRTGPGVVLTVDGVESRDAQDAGLALVGATGRVAHVSVVGSGPYGAVQIEPGPGGVRNDARRLVLDHVKVRRARSLGISVRQSSVRLDDVDLDGVAQEPNGDGTHALGDGLRVADADVAVGELRCGAVEGSAAWVTAGARLSAQRLSSAGAKQGALVVERGGEVDVGVLRVTGGGGPALSAWEDATASVEQVSVTSGPALWVDCPSGAQARVGRVEGPEAPERTRCVEVRGAHP